MNNLIKFSAIHTYFANNKKLLDRRENAFGSGHVTKIEFGANLLRIRGTVTASMKNKTYDVKVFLTDEFLIQKPECECPRGIVICHHIAATLFAAQSSISKTDISCSWKAAGKEERNVKTLRELYGITKHQISCLQNACKLAESEIESIAEKTIEQFKSLDWLNIRKLRITSSVFGQLLSCIRRNRYPASLYARLLGKLITRLY